MTTRSYPKMTGIACLLFALLASVLNAQSDKPTQVTDSGVRIYHDVPYLDPERTQTLDLYLPKSKSKKELRPAIVWIHGGGWGGGSKRDKREQVIGQTMAEQGYVVASPSYMLIKEAAPNPSFPTPILDCKNAVRFLRANAEKYGIDPDRIAVMGGSAGGHLALMVAYTEGIDDLEPKSPYPGVSSRVGAVGNFYGITNLLTRQMVDKKTAELTGRPANGSSPRFTGKSRAEGQELWAYASPVTHVKPGVPPTFITHGKKDTTVDYMQAIELANVLKENGVPYEMELLEEAGHTYYLNTWGKRKLEKDLTPILVAFLEQYMPAKK